MPPSTLISSTIVIVIIAINSIQPILVTAQCQRHLPTVDDPFTNASRSVITTPSARILAGLSANPVDLENIVTIAYDIDASTKDYRCIGSLIAPRWVITAAQCLVRPGRDFILYGGGHSLSGEKYRIIQTIPYPDWNAPSSNPSTQIPDNRHDIQLIQLAEPTIQVDPKPTPTSTPTPPPPPPPTDSDTNPNASTPASTTTPKPISTTPITPVFNFMRINTNENFAIAPAQSRYLRFKGFGLTESPEQNQQPLKGAARDLKFADLRTSSCNLDGFGDDSKRRICTGPNPKCGPCFGDIGGPLYDVDASGTASVLVGILSFRPHAMSDLSLCADNQPILYTAVAPYASWIASKVDEELLLYDLPSQGIGDRDLSIKSGGLPTIARTSIIVVCSLILISALTTCLVAYTLHALRRKRQRWNDGLNAEESFVNGRQRDAEMEDPFEGIAEDQRTPRPSFTDMQRAAVRGATELSTRSLGRLRALMHRENEDRMEASTMSDRQRIENAPSWLNTAWEKLFRSTSRSHRDIHRAPTQHVVEDVLEGQERNIEPSVQSVAYQASRQEANVQLEWAKLEMRTTMRNASESSVTAPIDSASSDGGPSSRNPTSGGSRNPTSGRRFTWIGPRGSAGSSVLGSGGSGASTVSRMLSAGSGRMARLAPLSGRSDADGKPGGLSGNGSAPTGNGESPGANKSAVSLAALRQKIDGGDEEGEAKLREDRDIEDSGVDGLGTGSSKRLKLSGLLNIRGLGSPSRKRGSHLSSEGASGSVRPEPNSLLLAMDNADGAVMSSTASLSTQSTYRHIDFLRGSFAWSDSYHSEEGDITDGPATGESTRYELDAASRGAGMEGSGPVSQISFEKTAWYGERQFSDDRDTTVGERIDMGLPDFANADLTDVKLRPSGGSSSEGARAYGLQPPSVGEVLPEGLGRRVVDNEAVSRRRASLIDMIGTLDAESRVAGIGGRDIGGDDVGDDVGNTGGGIGATIEAATVEVEQTGDGKIEDGGDDNDDGEVNGEGDGGLGIGEGVGKSEGQGDQRGDEAAPEGLTLASEALSGGSEDMASDTLSASVLKQMWSEFSQRDKRGKRR